MNEFKDETKCISTANKPLSTRAKPSTCTNDDYKAASEAYVSEALVNSIRADLDKARADVALGAYVKSQIVTALNGAPNPSFPRSIDEMIALFVALYLGFEMPDLVITTACKSALAGGMPPPVV